mgnify:CR=1 FL=1
MQYFHLQMQVQNGFILIKMILRVGQRLRVLWKTGYPFFVAKHTTKRSGGPFLVKKPVINPVHLHILRVRGERS